jgi:rod shape-determining protein MreB
MLVRGGRSVHEQATVVAMRAGSTYALGNPAAALEGRTPRGLDVIRPLDGGLLLYEEAATALLRSVLEKRFMAKMRRARVILGMPLEASGLERQARLSLVRDAGALEATLVPEPVATALGADPEALKPRGVMVVDIGAGKVQAAVVSLGGLVIGRCMHLGGDAMDEALRRWLRHHYSLAVGRRTAEQLKRALGNALQPLSRRTTIIGGLDGRRGLPGRIEISADEVYDALRPLLDAIVAHVRSVLDETPPELSADVLVNGIILTGGGAQLSRLDELLALRTGLKVQRAACLTECTVQGLQVFLREPRLRRKLEWKRWASRSGITLLTPMPRAQGPLRRWGLPATLVSASVALLLAHGMWLNSPAMPLESAIRDTISPLQMMSATAMERSDTIDPAVLRAQLEQLSVENQRLRVMAADDKHLRQLLSWMQGPGWNGRAAPVIARDGAAWFGTLTVGAGSHDGISTDNVVTSMDGLVGRISSAGQSSSQVRLLTDKDHIVPCYIERSNAGGLLYGDGSPSCELRYLDPDASVRVGDIVRTSGLNGSFPRGLQVGRVVSVGGRENIYRVVTVRPTADVGSLSTVVVLSPETTR